MSNFSLIEEAYEEQFHSNLSRAIEFFPFPLESILWQRTVPTPKILEPVCRLEGLWTAEYGRKYCIDERKLGRTLSGSTGEKGRTISALPSPFDN